MGGSGSRRKAILGTQSHLWLDLLHSMEVHSIGVAMMVWTLRPNKHRQGRTCPPRSIPSTHQLLCGVWVDDGRLWKQEKGHPWHPLMVLARFYGSSQELQWYGLCDHISICQGSTCPPSSIPCTHQLPCGLWVDDGRLWKQDKGHPWHPIPLPLRFYGCLLY
jgi:hypothetical protein